MIKIEIRIILYCIYFVSTGIFLKYLSIGTLVHHVGFLCTTWLSQMANKLKFYHTPHAGTLPSTGHLRI